MEVCSPFSRVFAELAEGDCYLLTAVPIQRRPALVSGRRKSFQLYDLIQIICVDLADVTKT